MQTKPTVTNENQQSQELIVFNPQLEAVVNESNLPIDESTAIKKSYTSFFQQIYEIKEAAKVINFEEPTEFDETLARELRLKTVKVRTGCEVIKTNRKKIHLLKAEVEQNAFNLIKSECMLDEERYFQVEKNRQIKQQQKENELNEQRAFDCEEVKEWIPLGLQLGKLSQEDFDKLLKGAKLQSAADKSAKEAAAKEAAEIAAKEAEEAEALKKATIEAAEKAAAEAKELAEASLKLAKETEAAAKAAAKEAAEKAAKAAKEAAAKAAKAKEESDKAIAAAKAEAAAAAAVAAKAASEIRALELEKAAKVAAEKAAKEAAEAAIEAAEAAPDKDKLISIGINLKAICTDMPTFKTKKAQKISVDIFAKINDLIYDLRESIKTI